MLFYEQLIQYNSDVKLSGFNYVLDAIIGEKYLSDPNFVYPYYVNILLTRACNTKCLYCSADSGMFLNKIQFDREALLESFKNFMDNCNPCIVALCGGEPMLYPNDCNDIINICNSHVAIYLLTNLNYRLSKERMDVFSKIAKHRYSLIQTSIDTLNESVINVLRKGSNLELIKSNIITLKNEFNNVQFKVNITVSEYNYSEIGEIIKYCHELNVDYVHCNFVIPIGRAKRFFSWKSFINVLNGIESAVVLKKKIEFKELTISIPVEVIIINDLFYGYLKESKSIQLSSKQFVCNINPVESTSYAGWSGSNHVSYDKRGILDAYIDAASKSDEKRFSKCHNCFYVNICETNNAFFSECFIEVYKNTFESLVKNSNFFSKKELAKNRVFNLLQDMHYSACIDVAITNMCNGKCFFCQVEGNRNDEKTYFSINDLEKFIGKNAVALSITGGEPLIRGDFVKEAIKTVKTNSNSTVNLLTNLSLLTDDEIEIIAEKYGYYDVVQVSIYASNPQLHEKICGRKDWDVVNKNIKKLVENNVTVRANLTINEHNIYELSDIYDFYIGLGVDHINISPLLKKGFASELVDIKYILSYVFAVSDFATKKHEKYNVAIPIEAFRCYHKCLEKLGETSFQVEKNEVSKQNMKLLINYDGEIYYSDTMEYVGNIKNVSIENIKNKVIKNDYPICQKCKAYSMCGGMTKFKNGHPNAYCDN